MTDTPKATKAPWIKPVVRDLPVKDKDASQVLGGARKPLEALKGGIKPGAHSIDADRDTK